MTDRMFAFMAKAISISNEVGWFDLAALRVSDDDLPQMLEAQQRGWFIIKAYDSRVTKEGFDAYLSEKDKRDCLAEESAYKRAAESRKKPLVILAKLALWLAGTIVAALIAHAVTVIFH